jgi:hypothetical protein
MRPSERHAMLSGMGIGDVDIRTEEFAGYSPPTRRPAWT